MKGIGPSGSLIVVETLSRRLADQPADSLARYELAAELHALDRPSDALNEIELAWNSGLQRAETALLRGHILVRMGNLRAAAAAYRQALGLRPDHVLALTALAGLLPQLGAAETALEIFDAALAAAPDEPQVWIAAMNMAKAQRDYGRLGEWARAAERRFGVAPMISGFIADALAGTGQVGEAVDIARSLAEAQPANPAALGTLAYLSLMSADYGEAERAAAEAARIAPLDQSSWALLGTAWRMLGDAREDWLCRYDELIMPIEIELPEGLSDALLARHHASSHPADQSLRGGTQTAGNLFGSGDPLIQTTACRLAEAIEERLAQLPADAGHPFLARNSKELAFSASWSVRLTSQGFHEGHVHAAGWLSSALYVALPPEVRSGDGTGTLTFGSPDAALGLNLEPRRVVQPREGLLVLFPSYLWHGTTPFESAELRLTVAFDAVPMDNAPSAS